MESLLSTLMFYHRMAPCISLFLTCKRAVSLLVKLRIAVSLKPLCQVTHFKQFRWIPKPLFFFLVDLSLSSSTNIDEGSSLFCGLKGPTRKVVRDFLEGHVVTGQGEWL